MLTITEGRVSILEIIMKRHTKIGPDKEIYASIHSRVSEVS